MKRILLTMLILMASFHAAISSQQTKSELESTITTQLPSSGSGAITAAILRQVLQDMVDSNQQIPLVNAVTSTSYTLLTSDQGKLVTYNNSSAGAWTLPAANGDFAAGYNLFIQTIGTGTLTITVGSGTINGASTLVLEGGEAAFIVSAGGDVYRAVNIYSEFSPLADLISSVQGTMLYRGSSAWEALAPGTTGQTMTTSGSGANPLWTSAGTGTVTSITCGVGLDGGTITASGTCDISNQISANTAGTENASLTITFNDQGQLTTVTTQTISAITAANIADSSKTGNDGTLATGTAGTASDLAIWNGDGDLVDGPTPPSGTIVGTTDSQVLTNKTISGASNTLSLIDLTSLEAIADGRILANVSGVVSPAAANTFSDVTDTVSDGRGTVLHRTASAWEALPPGTSGQFLKTNGVGADVTWADAAGGGTVTAVTQGIGLTFSSNPITTTGTISVSIGGLTEITTPVSGDFVMAENSGGTVSKANVSKIGIGRETIGWLAGSLTPCGSDGAGITTRTISSVTQTVAGFDATTAECAFLTHPTPKSWNLGVLNFRVNWTTIGGSSSEFVEWDIACGAFSDGDSIDFAVFGTAVTVSDVWAQDDQWSRTAETPDLTVGNTPAEGDSIICRIQRDTTADDLAADAELLTIEEFYTSNANTDD